MAKGALYIYLRVFSGQSAFRNQHAIVAVVAAVHQLHLPILHIAIQEEVVAQQIHLQNGLLGAARFHAEVLLADDVVLLLRLFRGQFRCGGFGQLVAQALAVFHQAAGQQIHGGIQRFFPYLVLEEDGQIIGSGTVLPDGETEAEIVAAFLIPESIGRGYGRKLFETLEADELAVKAERVWLTSSDMALGFYEHMGWVNPNGYRG